MDKNTTKADIFLANNYLPIKLSDEDFHNLAKVSSKQISTGKYCKHGSPQNKWTCTREIGHMGDHVGHYVSHTNYNIVQQVVGVWANTISYKNKLSIPSSTYTGMWNNTVFSDYLLSYLPKESVTIKKSRQYVLPGIFTCGVSREPLSCSRMPGHTGLHIATSPFNNTIYMWADGELAISFSQVLSYLILETNHGS